jgi:prepilin-type N-terminal cleavage/methylation domain-containing protein/prepilin-type processing-associated H-X9-DG protein
MLSGRMERGRRGAFTLVELLVVIGIIALLISILLPSLNAARKQARITQCLSNMRQLGNGQQIYANQYRGWAVPHFSGPKTAAPNQRTPWQNNNDFRLAIGQPLAGPGATKYNNRFALGLICPEATQSLDKANQWGAPVQLSYSYNNTASVILPAAPLSDDDYFRGRIRNRVVDASSKLMYVDGLGANLSRGERTDYYGEQPNYDETKDTGEKAYVHYRHGRNKDYANVLFWDGHGATLHRSSIVAVDNKSPNWNTLWNPTKKK